MELRILYDNTTTRPDLPAGNGFACLVRRPGRPDLLFDTGEDGALLLANAGKLGVDLRGVGAVFLSHAHSDHTGGLRAVLAAGGAPLVYVPASFRHDPIGRDVARPVPPERLVYCDTARELEPGVFTTGELAGVEHCLVVATPAGGVVVTGCSHPGVPAILAAARALGPVRGFVGGLHGMHQAGVLASLQLVVPCHCSTDRPWGFHRFPASFVPGGVGREFSI